MPSLVVIGPQIKEKHGGGGDAKSARLQPIFDQNGPA